MKKFWLVVGVIAGLLVITLLGVAVALIVVLFGDEAGIGGGEEIAVVEVRGEIIDPRGVVALLRRYEKRKQVKAIVLRVDSPGGGVAASQEIFSAVNRIREAGKIKVVASLGNVAASGGYYVACGSETIVANPGTVTGSIGAIVQLVNLQELLAMVGVRFETVRSGPYKDIGSFSREMTLDERALLQTVVDDIHRQFVEAVAERRGMSVEEVKRIADGRLLTGAQALEMGLVDQLGGLQDAIDLAAELASIKGEPRILLERKRRGLADYFIEEAAQVMDEAARLTGMRGEKLIQASYILQ